MIKKNIKLLMGIIIGGIVFGSIGVYGTGKLYASSIDVDTSKMSELGETSNVNLALNYLYGKAASLSSNSGIKMYPTIQSDILITYLNPVDLTEYCNANNSISTPGTKSGCMKWYIYKKDRSKYYALLDHNTTAGVAYNSEGGSTKKEVAEALDSDTTNWGITDEIELNPRLITVQEVASIIGFDSTTNWQTYSNVVYFDGPTSSSTTSWNSSTIYSKGKSAYAWLFDYTDRCTTFGCNIADSSTSGYWTDGPMYSNYGLYPRVVNQYGSIVTTNIKYTSYGVRPVIEIPKSLFE